MASASEFSPVFAISNKVVGQDDFCDDAKFFTKIIYMLIGSCKVNKESVILICKPLSLVAGYLSITSWLFAQLPQVIKNYNSKSVDGISLGFLLCWFAGDFLNFLSCLMMEALPFQIILSGYYCIIDSILGFQFFFYTKFKNNYKLKLKKNQRLNQFKSPNSLLRDKIKRLNHEGTPTIIKEIDRDKDDLVAVPVEHIPIPNNNNDNHGINPHNNHFSNSFANLVSSSFIIGFNKAAAVPISFVSSSSASSSASASSSFVLPIIGSMSLGKILAWACTFLYLSSRLPQLVHNFQRKSVKGLSVYLVAAALFGNLTYSISLITSESSLDGGEISKQFWEKELSYFIGALGTVIFDLGILIQWYFWTDKRKSRPKTPRRTKTPRINTIISPIDKKNNTNTLSIERNTETSPLISNNNDENQNQKNYTSSTNHTTETSSMAIKNTARENSSLLSPNHAIKFSGNSPLSPIDFLIDDLYYQNKTNKMEQQTHSAYPEHSEHTQTS